MVKSPAEIDTLEECTRTSVLTAYEERHPLRTLRKIDGETKESLAPGRQLESSLVERGNQMTGMSPRPL